MPTPATGYNSTAALSWTRLYRDARKAGMQEWHSREYADRVRNGELELRDELERLLSLGCPKRLLAAIVL